MPNGTLVDVVLRGGNYPLNDTFRVGTQDPSLHLKAYGSEKPRLMAGDGAVKWRQEQWQGKRAFIADVKGDEPLQALYVNGVRAERARWPETGLLRLKDTGSSGRRNWGEAGTDHFAVDPDEWAKMGDASGASRGRALCSATTLDA